MPGFSPSDYSAILLSIKVAIVATLISLPFGFAVAYLMTFRKFRGRVALDVLVNLPLTVTAGRGRLHFATALGQAGMDREDYSPAIRYQFDFHLEGGGHCYCGGRLPPDGQIYAYGYGNY
jgi:ABC-type molybdate transport system permease subunit